MMRAQISKYKQAFQTDQGYMDTKAREDLILEYAPLVKYIADRMAIRLPHSMSKEDLTSAGIVGLYDALDKFDSEKGAKFQTYAEYRIKGAMLDELRKMGCRAQGISLLSLDEIMPDGAVPKFTNRTSDTPSPFDELKMRELKQVISKALLSISKKEQLVVSLYYYDELTLKEIGRVLDLTESRVSQIHSKAIIKLRAKLRSYYEGS
jgi:RNA polymerase sigma factor for flagellar operon FliA